MSYIEIYNEEIRDLLDPAAGKTLAIREHSDGRIVVAGAKELAATTFAEMQRLLDVGSVSRTVAGVCVGGRAAHPHKSTIPSQYTRAYLNIYTQTRNLSTLASSTVPSLGNPSIPEGRIGGAAAPLIKAQYPRSIHAHT